MAKKISAGTRMCFEGSTRVIVLAQDAEIEEVSDKEFVGLLVGSRETNWPLNIDNVEGKYSPVTGAREPDESVANELAVPVTPEMEEARDDAEAKAKSAMNAGSTTDDQMSARAANEPQQMKPLEDLGEEGEQGTQKKAAKKSASKKSAKKAAR